MHGTSPSHSVAIFDAAPLPMSDSARNRAVVRTALCMALVSVGMVVAGSVSADSTMLASVQPPVSSLTRHSTTQAPLAPLASSPAYHQLSTVQTPGPVPTRDDSIVVPTVMQYDTPIQGLGSQAPLTYWQLTLALLGSIGLYGAAMRVRNAMSPSSGLMAPLDEQALLSAPTHQWSMAAAATTEEGYTYDPSRIRNFAIIAHIDHGKSTLADRLLEVTKTVEARKMQAQLLDSMDIERERGITIKLNAARMEFKSKDGNTYLLNLIDTPGHVDFSYEVSRSLAACEGALLVVDAAQGIQAQTLANVYLALENDLEIIPVLNKIDLPAADPERIAEEVETVIGIDCSNAVRASAKAGIGIIDILENIVEAVPPPPAATAPDAPFRALIFDSYWDPYLGVLVSFRVVDGSISPGQKIRFIASGAEYEVIQVGVTTPERRNMDILRAGEVGWICAGIKSVEDARVGDTITTSAAAKAGVVEPLPGYSEAVPMVYCGLFPTEAPDYDNLRTALGKLRLNDASLSFEPETSSAMGFGFRCGFLGLLHMDVVQERLEREYDLDLVVTAPTVVYKVHPKDKPDQIEIVDNPSKMPDFDRQQVVTEPYVAMEILTPAEYTGKLMELCNERRGTMTDLSYITESRCALKYELPLAEVITDFFDEVKSKTSGYASLDYRLIEYRPGDLVRMDVRINGEPAPPLATVVHRDAAQSLGRKLVDSLKKLIPRQQFKVPIQACIGGKVIAATQIGAIMKDVLAKCYGGDISRKKKLLQKQAKGKKRMKMMGKVNVPQEAFLAVINIKKGDK